MAERAEALDAGGRPPARPAKDEPRVDVEGQTVLPVEQPAPVDDRYGERPLCVKRVRAGPCHVCEQCGTTSGCS